MAEVTVCSDFGAQENKLCHCFHFSPSICHEVMGLDAMIMTISCPPPCSLPTLGPSKVHGEMHSFKIHVGLCLQLGSTTYCVTLDKLLKFSELQSGI